jgi:hypothetical protein
MSVSSRLVYIIGLGRNEKFASAIAGELAQSMGIRESVGFTWKQAITNPNKLSETARGAIFVTESMGADVLQANERIAMVAREIHMIQGPVPLSMPQYLYRLGTYGLKQHQYPELISEMRKMRQKYPGSGRLVDINWGVSQVIKQVAKDNQIDRVPLMAEIIKKREKKGITGIATISTGLYDQLYPASVAEQIMAATLGVPYSVLKVAHDAINANPSQYFREHLKQVSG